MNKNTSKHIRYKSGSLFKYNDHERNCYACNSKVSRFLPICRQKVMCKIDIIDESNTTVTYLSIGIGLQTVIPVNRIST